MRRPLPDVLVLHLDVGVLLHELFGHLLRAGAQAQKVRFTTSWRNKREAQPRIGSAAPAAAVFRKSRRPSPKLIGGDSNLFTIVIVLPDFFSETSLCRFSSEILGTTITKHKAVSE